VSGNLHAMFVLRYVGGRNTARALAVLQRENIRLMVACQDPSLTARHIAEAYRLPLKAGLLFQGKSKSVLLSALFFDLSSATPLSAGNVAFSILELLYHVNVQDVFTIFLHIAEI